MKIIPDQIAYYKYAFVFDFSPEILNFCNYLKDTHGWKEFAFIENAWRFNDIRIAIEIRNRYNEVQIDENILIDLQLAFETLSDEVRREGSIEEIKASGVTDLIVEGLKQPLYPYQNVGVDFLVKSNGRAILADSMGVGKTCQALAYVSHTQKNKTLVICPASVKYAWQGEVKKWTDLHSKIVNGQSDEDIFEGRVTDIFIINYDIVIKFFRQIIEAEFDCLIIDECQYVKNSRAKRTKVVKQISRGISSVILLSGTPMLSRPVELFNALNIIDPKAWGNYYAFTTRYCQGHMAQFGWDARGASNIGELQQKIGKYFLRRTKSDVLPGLPEKVFINRPIELDPETQKRYDMAEHEFGKFLRDVKKKKTPEIAKSLQAEKLVKLGALRQITTQGKIKTAEEIIDEVVDGGEKMLVFSCYNEPLIKLHEKYRNNSVILTGGDDALSRRTTIERFQQDDKIRIFFGGTKSAGIGITLTAATVVLFVDYSWTPADHAQAIDRVHRPGQKGIRITIYHIFCLGTIDEYMAKLLEKKQILFDRIIEGVGSDISSGKSMVSDILKMLEKDSNDAGA